MSSGNGTYDRKSVVTFSIATINKYLAKLLNIPKSSLKKLGLKIQVVKNQTDIDSCINEYNLSKILEFLDTVVNVFDIKLIQFKDREEVWIL